MYRYRWKNNEKRKAMYGRMCRIIITGRKNSVLVEFEDGQMEIVSVRALRRVASDWKTKDVGGYRSPGLEGEQVPVG